MLAKSIFSGFLLFAVSTIAAGEDAETFSGKIMASKPLKALIFAPVTPAGGKPQPPVLIPVGADGRFETRKLKAGTYQFSTDPACVPINGLELDEGAKRIEVRIQVSGSSKESTDAGVLGTVRGIGTTAAGLGQIGSGGIVMPGLCSGVPSEGSKTDSQSGNQKK